MAIFSAALQTIQRSAGRSSTAAAAYRSGELIHDERTGLTHDYTRRSGVEATGLAGWQGERAELWNAAEAAERINGRPARELMVAIPAELATPEERRILVEGIADDLRLRYGVAIDWAIHRPSAAGDQRNFHAHIMFTTREVEGGVMGRKTRILDQRSTSGAEVETMRAQVAGRINGALERAQVAAQVDHRSYRRQDAHLPEEMQREPGVHLGPAATAMERREVPSELGELNQLAATRNAARQARLVAQEHAIHQARAREAAARETAEAAAARAAAQRAAPAPAPTAPAVHPAQAPAPEPPPPPAPIPRSVQAALDVATQVREEPARRAEAAKQAQAAHTAAQAAYRQAGGRLDAEGQPMLPNALDAAFAGAYTNAGEARDAWRRLMNGYRAAGAAERVTDDPGILGQLKPDPVTLARRLVTGRTYEVATRAARAAAVVGRAIEDAWDQVVAAMQKYKGLRAHAEHAPTADTLKIAVDRVPLADRPALAAAAQNHPAAAEIARAIRMVEARDAAKAPREQRTPQRDRGGRDR